MKYLIILCLFFFGCDMSQEEIMKSDMPNNCKFTLLCWKKFEKVDKSACEKFAIRCSDELKEWERE